MLLRNDYNTAIFEPFVTDQYGDQLKFLIQKFDESYEVNALDDALTSIALAFHLYELHPDDDSKTILITKAVKIAPLLNQIPDIEEMLNSIISLEMFEENKETISACYFMKSVLYIQSNEFEKAAVEAKMAYFWGSRVGGNSELVCNAKLQHVWAYMLLGSNLMCEQLLKEYNWYTENCLNDAEKVLLTAIHLGIAYNEDKNAEPIESFLEKLAKSKEKQYVPLLKLYFRKLLLCKAEQENEVLFKQELQSNLLPVVNAKTFFERGNKYYEKLKTEGEPFYIYKATIKEDSFNLVKSLYKELNKMTEKKIRLTIFSHVKHRYTLITPYSIEQLNEFEAFKQINFIDSLFIDEAKYDNFIEAYNYLTLKMVKPFVNPD